MNALHVLSSEFPDQTLTEITTAHPLLHSRITELQVHTLMSANFSDHEIWTRAEIKDRLGRIAHALNSTASSIYPNELTNDGCFRHAEYVHRPAGSQEE